MNDMHAEGVIQFDLQWRETPPLPDEQWQEINVWRQMLFNLGLIGQDPARYGGLGFGNISQRIPPYTAPPQHRPFVITATQTGGLADLDGRHYTRVSACFPAGNRVIAEGPRPPSSECMTHGQLYGLDDALRVVIHVHAPALWRKAAILGIPVTDPSIGYGTPAMAAAVERLYRDGGLSSRRLFVMGGHVDGVVSFGATAGEAGGVLIDTLSQALYLEARG